MLKALLPLWSPNPCPAVPFTLRLQGRQRSVLNHNRVQWCTGHASTCWVEAEGLGVRDQLPLHIRVQGAYLPTRQAWWPKAFNPTWPHDLEVRLGSVRLSQKHISKSNASNAILDAEPRTQATRRTRPPPSHVYPKPLRWGRGIIHSPTHQPVEGEDTHNKEQVVDLKMQWANKHLKRGQKVTKGTRPGPRKCKSKKMLQLSQRQEVMPSP